MAKALGGFTLFVSRLSSYSTDQSLKKLFSPFGAVKEARLIRDSVTKKPKGFGFVTFESEIEAQQAVKGMNCRIVDGRLILLKLQNCSPWNRC
ncbi:hypothetical protein K2173_022874 [Erythroxylum novogranatense]|uniref:RRM domain-containing protein n=1 Tax=Erythroxylum novogranatense TaxID=1862640 RepID=A0AAV8TZ57_9ROSI|nr:hypothetical protein K2173_022874 [Erythroxylum novogranatense]